MKSFKRVNRFRIVSNDKDIYRNIAILRFKYFKKINYQYLVFFESFF